MGLRRQLRDKVMENQANNKIAYLDYRNIGVRDQRFVAG